MERSGTLAEPSDNSTTPYIKKRPTLLGQPLVIVSSHEDYRRLITAHQDPDCQDRSVGRSEDHSC